MKFSTKTLYGLRAILVLASRFGEGSISVSQIAKKENISVAYLEQILNALKKKGLVKSVRGPQGGYILAKKPSEISLESLFYILEDKAFAGFDGKIQKLEDADEIAVANIIFWNKLKDSVAEGLAKISLKGLIDESRRIKKSKGGRLASPTYTFHI